MGKCAIYARVSTVDRQDFQRQVSDCRTAIGEKYCEGDVEVFAEQISGYKAKENRPQLTKLLNIIENDSSYFDIIYVTEISRLGREPKETRNLIDNLTEKKIPIFITSINRKTLEENGERDSVMNIILQVLIEFSDSESRTMKKRSQSGLLQSAKVEGKAGGGKYLPYGYAKDENKKLVIDESESKIIMEIFQYYKDGNGCKKIAGYLNDRNIPTRTNISFENQTMKYKTEKNSQDVTWVDKTINDIIRNSIYKGDRKFKGEIIKAPAIITKQLYDECLEIMETKTHRNYLTTYTYLLKDLLVCGCCGRSYFAKFKPVEGGDKVYICSSRLKKGGNCGNIGINISLLESAIYNEVDERLIVVLFRETKDVGKNLKAQITRLENDLNSNQKLVDKIEIRKERILDLYEDGKISISKYDQRIAEINKEEIELSNKINIITNELFESKKILDKQTDRSTLTQMFSDARNNRIELATIFKQIISKVVITPHDKNNAVIDLHLLIDGYPSPYPLRMVLDLSGIRLKPIQYRYRPYYMQNNGESDEDYSQRINDIDHIIREAKLETVHKSNRILIEEIYPIK